MSDKPPSSKRPQADPPTARRSGATGKPVKPDPTSATGKGVAPDPVTGGGGGTPGADPSRPADRQPRKDIPMLKRGGGEEAGPGKSFLRLLGWLIPLIALGYVAYMLFIGTDARRRFTTVEETLTGYTEYVSRYVGPAGARPDERIVSHWLRFFDNDSRRFFENNARRIARFHTHLEPGRFESLPSGAIRSEAMIHVINRPPLNGIASILEQRNVDATTIHATVVTRDLTRRRIILKQEGSLYYLAELGGLRQELERDLERFEQHNPEPGT